MYARRSSVKACIVSMPPKKSSPRSGISRISTSFRRRLARNGRLRASSASSHTSISSSSVTRDSPVATRASLADFLKVGQVPQRVYEDRGAGGDVERLHLPGAGDGDDGVAGVERGARQPVFLVAKHQRNRLLGAAQRLERLPFAERGAEHAVE